MPASPWVQPTPRSAAAGDATPGQDSATANQEWQGPSVTGASWATGALEKTAAAPVTAPETATSAPAPASMGKETLLWLHFEMGLCEMKKNINKYCSNSKHWRVHNLLKRWL